MTVLTNLRFFVHLLTQFIGILLEALYSRILNIWTSASLLHLPEVRLHLGVRGSSFTLETLPEENTSEFFKHQRVNKSVCVHIRLHSQSLLSGQGVRSPSFPEGP